jgi:hypothetical protein
MSAWAAGSAGRAELGARRGGVNGVGVPNGSRESGQSPLARDRWVLGGAPAARMREAHKFTRANDFRHLSALLRELFRCNFQSASIGGGQDGDR